MNWWLRNWEIGDSRKTSSSQGYIEEFEIVDDHRSGKIVVFLNGRLNKCGVISPRFDVQQKDVEQWASNLLPSRQFGWASKDLNYLSLCYFVSNCVMYNKPSVTKLKKNLIAYDCMVVLCVVVCIYSCRFLWFGRAVATWVFMLTFPNTINPLFTCCFAPPTSGTLCWPLRQESWITKRPEEKKLVVKSWASFTKAEVSFNTKSCVTTPVIVLRFFVTKKRYFNNNHDSVNFTERVDRLLRVWLQDLAPMSCRERRYTHMEMTQFGVACCTFAHIL